MTVSIAPEVKGRKGGRVGEGKEKHRAKKGKDHSKAPKGEKSLVRLIMS